VPLLPSRRTPAQKTPSSPRTRGPRWGRGGGGGGGPSSARVFRGRGGWRGLCPCPVWVPACAGMTGRGERRAPAPQPQDTCPKTPSSPRTRGPRWGRGGGGGGGPSSARVFRGRGGSRGLCPCPVWVPACAGMTGRDEGRAPAPQPQDTCPKNTVIPAHAGTQVGTGRRRRGWSVERGSLSWTGRVEGRCPCPVWVPACAGMTGVGVSGVPRSPAAEDPPKTPSSPRTRGTGVSGR
jgi:hypothetical protein